MRTEAQVIDQLLNFASYHENIRAVVMNGSRVNPNAPQDIFCDYDVVFYGDFGRSYLDDRAWIRYFGNLIILQQNDFNEHGNEGYIFMMQFTDGVRIDLSFQPLANLAYLGEDSLTHVLLDKDGRTSPLPPSSDSGYWTRRPSRKLYDETVNEFFWVATYVAKGIWRDELPYAKYMFDSVVRPALMQMLAWYAAMDHGWSINTGKFGKYLKKYLPRDIWDLYVCTYAGADYEDIWQALFRACRLMRQLGPEVARRLGYEYPDEDDRRVVIHLARVRSLPRGAADYEQAADRPR